MTLEELTRKRDRCKEALDRAQKALNERLLADSPVRRGDLIQDESGTMFRISSVCVKTSWNDEGKLHDRVVYELQQKRKIGTDSRWSKVRFNATNLASRVLSGQVKVVRHAQVV